MLCAAEHLDDVHMRDRSATSARDDPLRAARCCAACQCASHCTRISLRRHHDRQPAHVLRSCGDPYRAPGARASGAAGIAAGGSDSSPPAAYELVRGVSYATPATAASGSPEEAAMVLNLHVVPYPVSYSPYPDKLYSSTGLLDPAALNFLESTGRKDPVGRILRHQYLDTAVYTAVPGYAS
eukprot:SAG31_NODE_7734_length_1606_cov_1.945587_1_plen_182_part_00